MSVSGIGKLAVLTILTVMVSGLRAQDETTWLMEVGLGGGGSFYMGDANQSLYRNTNGAASVIARYNFNPRFSVKGIMGAAGISGSPDGSFGELPQQDIPDFSRTVYGFSLQAEWGFLGYMANEWAGGSRLAPYGLAGLGLDFIPAPAANDFALSIPLGLGLRYKLSDRSNIGFEWSMHFTGSDRLDVGGSSRGNGLENPLLINGKGLKNKDSYCVTMLYLTFDVFRKPCHCNDE